MHQMVTSKQPMANWYGTVEYAGHQKEENHTQEGQNDELVMPLNGCSKCGHDKTSLFSLSVDSLFAWSNSAVSGSVSNGALLSPSPWIPIYDPPFASNSIRLAEISVRFNLPILSRMLCKAAWSTIGP
jgi:hypothetical protein